MWVDEDYLAYYGAKEENDAISHSGTRQFLSVTTILSTADEAIAGNGLYVSLYGSSVISTN